MRRIRYFLREIRRVIEWLPVIWRNHDYDFGYNLDIFRYSLERTARHILEHSFIEDAGMVAGQIENVVEMIRSYQEGRPMDAAVAVHEMDWGKARWIHFPAIGHPEGFTEAEMYYDKADTIEKEIQAEEEMDDLMDEAFKEQRELWQRIWHTIAEQMKGWWD